MPAGKAIIDTMGSVTTGEATYYVDSTNGTDTSVSGSYDTPYKTFQFALDNLPDIVKHITWLKYKSAQTVREEVYVTGKSFYYTYVTGTATGGSTTTLINTNETRDWQAILYLYYHRGINFTYGLNLEMTSGDNIGLSRRIISYNNVTDTFATDAFPNTNDNGDTYRIKLEAFIGIIGDEANEEFRTGTATGNGAAGGTTLVDSGASDFTNYVDKNYFLKCTSGANNGVLRRITAFDNGTKTFTVEKFDNQIVTDVTYEIWIVCPNRNTYLWKGSDSGADTTAIRDHCLYISDGQRVFVKGIKFQYAKHADICCTGNNMVLVKGVSTNDATGGIGLYMERGCNVFGASVTAYNNLDGMMAIQDGGFNYIEQIAAVGNSSYGIFNQLSGKIYYAKDISTSSNSSIGFAVNSGAQVYVDGLVSNYNSSLGIHQDGCSGSVIRNFRSCYNSSHGMLLYHGANANLYNFKFDNNGGHGIQPAFHGYAYVDGANSSSNNSSWGLICSLHAYTYGVSTMTLTGNGSGASSEDTGNYAKIN